MTSLQRFQCPTCGALLREDPTRGAVRCDYCKRRSTLADGSLLAAPRQRLVPTLDRSEAVLALRRGLVDTGVLPGSLRAAIRPVEVRLVYAPFHVARGLRLGTVTRQPEPVIEWQTATSENGHVVSRQMVRRPSDEPAQAKVVLTDAERIAPAVRKREWGLDELDVGGLLVRGATAVPYDRNEIRDESSVLSTEVALEEALGWLDRQSATTDMTLVAPSVRTLLVPVWRIRYEVQGCRYDATLDAVEGRLLAARAPENDSHRIPIALGYVGAASLALGFSVRGLRWMFVSPGMPEISFFLGIVVVFLVAMFGTYAWHVVRYDAERIWSGGRVWSEYLNKPPSTGLERFWERLFGGLTDGSDLPGGGRGHG